MTSPWGEAFSDLAWAKIRPWLWLGAAVIAALVLWRAYALGAKHERNEWRPKVERLRGDLAAAEAGIKVLNEGLAVQSAAVEAAGREAVRTRAEVANVKREAAKRRLPGIVGRLDRGEPGEVRCPVSPLNVEAWKGLQ